MDVHPAQWTDAELQDLRADYPDVHGPYDTTPSKYNPRPDWKAMYQPSPEQAEKDRLAAYEAGIPHGYVPPGNKYKDLPTIHLQVVSDLAVGGIIPALQKLSYAGKNFEDSQRSLQQ
ncbi:hypothetical protein ABBQ38_003846 [Trebouxia sp. C0009 RCD-2024]